MDLNTWSLLALLSIAVVIGGGGVGSAFANGIIQVCALILLVAGAPRVWAFVTQASLVLRLLVGLTIFVPLAQLLPLPPSVWQALPGRDLAVQAFDVVGYDTSSWHPFSVWPLRTVLACVGLIAPFAVCVFTYGLSRRHFSIVFLALLGLACANLLLGAVQLASANSIGFLYADTPAPDQFYGTFANHNTSGVFLVVSMCVLAALWKAQRLTLWATVIGEALLCLAVVLTQSRSSIALAVLAVILLFAGDLVGAFKRRRRTRSHSRSGRKMAVVAAAAIVVILGAGALLLNSSRTSMVLERYGAVTSDSQFREVIWADALYSAQRFMPLGAGVGSFDAVFQIDESLETLSPGRAGRAHNEILEVAIESGVAGLVLLAAWVIFVGIMLVRVVRAGDRGYGMCSGVALLCLGLQSIVDYPLRTQAGLCLFAFLTVILLRVAGRVPVKPGALQDQ